MLFITNRTYLWIFFSIFLSIFCYFFAEPVIIYQNNIVLNIIFCIWTAKSHQPNKNCPKHVWIKWTTKNFPTTFLKMLWKTLLAIVSFITLFYWTCRNIITLFLSFLLFQIFSFKVIVAHENWISLVFRRIT